ncbi:spermidine synthase [Geobacter sp. SVR]|uniref:spermidine synthase n=1 Tax=Geobacter sp. SVR TaxID=2495594 RepID=UPI00143F0150|nr:spermidine synthase [Geobacter sp. SVR]BCS54372.1 spermidine synthase [Geobacter sp. SVR]GCF87459.1 spermidine synthase [Geobacter sp. SVR]
MAQPWKIIDRIETDEGALELRQRGERDFLIMIGNQVLMNSLANRSEVELGRLGCRGLQERERPRVLVGGLGMGCTLRGVLDSLPAAAGIVVAELNPVVLEWCRGPLAELTGNAVADPRVEVRIGDVADLIRRSAAEGGEARFDALVLDLYRGPHAKTDPVGDPLYGSRAIENMRRALRPGGTVAVWGEQYDEGFDRRLQKAGFTVSTTRPGRGGLRHAVFLGQLK